MDILSGAAVAIYLLADRTHMHIRGHDAQTLPAKGYYLD
jgi:hypothetical protein